MVRCLDPQAATKIVTAVMRLRLGNTSNLKGIGTITEYRINWGPGYRIYLAEDGNAWVLLGGGHAPVPVVPSRSGAGEGLAWR